jgi:hypothetical protein
LTTPLLLLLSLQVMEISVEAWKAAIGCFANRSHLGNTSTSSCSFQKDASMPDPETSAKRSLPSCGFSVLRGNKMTVALVFLCLMLPTVLPLGDVETQPDRTKNTSTKRTYILVYRLCTMMVIRSEEKKRIYPQCFTGYQIIIL